jgi:hypothetical protein
MGERYDLVGLKIELGPSNQAIDFKGSQAQRKEL